VSANGTDLSGGAATEDRRLGPAGDRLVRLGAVAGVAGIGLAAAVAAATNGFDRFLFAWLLNFSFFLTVALGGLFMVVLHHLVRAGWSVVVRRLAEGLASTLPLLALLFVPILLGMKHLFHWSVPALVANDPVLLAKAAFLNVPFFVLRWAVYFASWILTTRYFVSRSLAQDDSGDVGLTLEMQRASAPSILAFGLTSTFASVDLLLSLDAHWYSTMFGVYFFAGCVVAVFASLIVMAWAAQAGGLLQRSITVEHYHDLGKLLFGFVVFWAYIAFSQYMLIWYANIPEETGWFLRRQTHGWGAVGLVLILGHFAGPFVALMSRVPKRRPGLLALAAAWLLAMHWVDLYWVVMPEASPEHAAPHVVDFALLVGFGGLFVAAAARALRGRSLVPERDPRLDESLNFENA
jgi:hypothetical protein